MLNSILIAGCGALGNGLGQAIAKIQPKTKVYGLRRNIAALAPTLQGISADLSQPSSLKDLPNVDALVYTATPAERNEDAYRAAYLAGLENLLAAMPCLPDRFIYVSSTSVLADSAGAWVNEDTVAEPETATAALLREGEKLALANGALVLRFAGIYGPKRLWLLRAAQQDSLRCHFDPPQWTNRIHEYDCIGALQHLLQRGFGTGVLHAVDDEPAPRYEVLKWLREQLQLAPIAIESAVESAQEQGKRVSNQALRATGWRPHFPSYREGYLAILRELDSSKS